MCEHLNMTDLVDMPEDGIVRRKCGELCANCFARIANIYGVPLPVVASPPLNAADQDVIGPEQEATLRQTMVMRREIELRESGLWIFD